MLVMIGLVATESIVAINVIPLPNSYQLKEGEFRFDADTKWIIENEAQARLLDTFTELFRISANYHYNPQIGGKARRNYLLFKTDATLDKEAYELSVTKKSIVIEASGDKGFYYALQTLKQLLPVELMGEHFAEGVSWSVPAVIISDSPQFHYRGFMLDVSRYFMPKEDLLRLIDNLAFHKINYLHLHLVDDNGWRLEIKKYPALTDIGAWRVERNSFFSMRTNPQHNEATPVGGYYTQEDIKEIVAYAQERFVEIIPEIEMPAHTNSSLAAYPELACPVVEKPIHVLPGIGGKNSSIIYCAGNDQVFHFLEDVIDEVVELFPGQYIHVGGDEANKEYWSKCPRCQQRIQEEGLESEEALQGYFIERMSQYIKSKGKKVMGWDELTNSKVPAGTTVMGWRGMGHAALKAADQGNPIIMTPARALYFIRYQGPQWFEPYTYFGNNTLQDVYAYNPFEAMTEQQAKHLQGIQGCLWTEFVTSPEDAEYLIFPRLAALAENAWTQKEGRSWEGFVKRVDKLFNIYEANGLHYATSLNNLFHQVKPVNQALNVAFSCIRPDVEIRYTTDGSEPLANSDLYSQAFNEEPSTVVRAAAFKNGVRMGQVLTLNSLKHKAAGEVVVSKEANAWLLTNGLLGSEKNTDGEYVDLYNKDGEFTIDLNRSTAFETIELSLLNNNGGGVHLPSKLVVSASIDGEHYETIGEINVEEQIRFQSGIYKTSLKLEKLGAQARYIHLQLTKPGNCPVGHVREGQPARIAIDELLIY